MIEFHIFSYVSVAFKQKSPRKNVLLRFLQGRINARFHLDFYSFYPLTQGMRRRLLQFRRATPEWSSLNLRKETPSKRFSLSVRQ